MVMLKFGNMILLFYILGIFVSDYPIEEATINKHTQACSSREWGCNNGECISFEKRCDREINCSDGSDEATKLCSPENLRLRRHSSSQDACVLPTYPDHGKYNMTEGLKPGDTVSKTLLIYSCDAGYSLEGESSSACVNGTWLAEAPTCSKQCKPLKSTSVDFKCYKQNSTLEISCDLPQDKNSRAKAKCKNSYHLKPAPKDLICIKGSWNYMPYCIPECGTVVPEGETLVINGEKAKVNEFPWHVGLYDKNSKPILQICGGNIFTPKLVITAAHCVYRELVGLHPASSFAVAAGKLYRRWNAPGDVEKYVQKIDVMKIEIPERYKGSINAYTADIAVLVLERSFVLSSYVRPVCIQFESMDNLNGEFGRVAGWGLTEESGLPSRTLQTVRLPFVSFQDCYDKSPESFRPLITPDKICAGYTNGTALCRGDSGGGLVFSRRNSSQDLYYLYGIVSTSPRNKGLTTCSAFAYTGFTNIKNHQEWLLQICFREWGCDNGGCVSLKQRCDVEIDHCSDGAGFCSDNKLRTSKNRCVLPPYPDNGNYSATAGLKPGDAVSHTALTYSCDEGYSLKGEQSSICILGSWIVEVPTCERQCKPLKSTSVDFKCHKQYSTEEIACDLPQESNSRAKPVCKDWYHSVASRKDLICINGSWDYMPHCTPECGIAGSSETVLIDGKDELINDFPWHVDVYNKNSKSILQTCGGSIVTPNLVVTAAHCVYNDQAGVYPASSIAVAAYKFYLINPRNFENYVQNIDVIKIEIPESYKGAINGYTADIAVLVLERSFVLSNFVRPVCISFDHRDNLNGQLGMVAAWGRIVGNGRPSQILQTVRLPFASFLDCYDNSTESLRPIITPGKICEGSTNGMALCKGDGGGGLVFALWQDLFYLYGIVSTYRRNEEKTSCNEFAYPMFTDIINHQEWLQQIWEWGCDNGGCFSLKQKCDGEMNSCTEGNDEEANFCSANKLRISKDLCILPPYPDNGKYNATTGLEPGDVVSNIFLTYSCDEGYGLKGNRSPFCIKGKWVAEVPTCERQCKPLMSTSVDFKCYKQHSPVEISCELPQDNNSHAKPVCKYLHHLEPSPKDLICIDGSWDYMPYCTPECGIVSPQGEPLFINGEQANINELPWHVGVFYKDTEFTPLLCSGTIFTPKLVITAAHCVYKELVGVHPASSFAVAAGKLYRHWNASRENEKYVQNIDVIKIEIPERYKGSINAFTADVAVLVLERSFELNNFVRPVCISSFDYRDNLNGQLGRVAGWGITNENGLPSETLQTARLPLVSILECYWNSPENFRPLITPDKICAGYTNGTALCIGDDGGGLVFSRRNSSQDLYYLYGIVSTYPRNKEQTSCSAFAFTGFTNIMNYQEWLQQICLREMGSDNGLCNSLEKKFDGEINCSDGGNGAEKPCSTDNLSTSKNVCILPPYPSNGRYSVALGLKPGDAVSHISLAYTCDEGYTLKGKSSIFCVSGTWAMEVPTCERRQKV